MSLPRGVDEGVEAAAEAAAGDFLDGKLVGAAEGGIDEAGALVVGDEADAEAAVVEVFGRMPGWRWFFRRRGSRRS